MNERIKLLAEQATKQVTKPDGHYIVQEWQRVFAELIIRECIRIDIENPDAAPGVEIAKYFKVEK